MKPTTDVADALARSLTARRGVYAGWTWASFKQAMEALGVTDGDRLVSIEYGVVQGGSGRICLDIDDHGGIEIREGL